MPDTKKKFKPASTPEARENQLIALANDLAEERLRNGTASSQLVNHFLKEGSITRRLEKEKLQRENELLASKIKVIEEQKHTEELYEKALKALSGYHGMDEEYIDD